MSERAIASFEITTWDEQPYDDQDGIRLSRARVVKAFRGEIEGESTAELLMAVAGEDSAAYVGVERVTGRVSGRSGSFVYLHTATAAAGSQSPKRDCTTVICVPPSVSVSVTTISVPAHGSSSFVTRSRVSASSSTTVAFESKPASQ